MRCLLDKVVARRILQGLYALSQDRILVDEDRLALDLFDRLASPEHQAFIVAHTANVLDRLDHPPHQQIINLFRDRTQVAFPTRYAARWSRRLRDFGFTRESSRVLALATFGTDRGRSLLGMHCVATTDQAMIRNWIMNQDGIEGRFKTMQVDLLHPYSEARLPSVLPPAWVPA